MILQLTLTVEYADNGVTERYLKKTLLTAAEHLAGNGLLTGPSDGEVETWKCDVIRIDRPFHENTNRP